MVKLKLSPWYLTNSQIYSVVDDFTDGSHDRVKAHLIPYLTETSDDVASKTHYANRQNRSYNTNFCEPYLFVHLGHLTQNITIAPDDALAEHLENIDGEGTVFKHFVRDLLWYYMKDGLTLVLVNKSASISSNLSGARASNERSYAQRFDAKHLLALSRFEDGPRKGMLNRVMLQNGMVKNDKGKFLKVIEYKLEQTGPYTLTQYLVETGNFSTQNLFKHSELDAEMVGSPIIGALDRIPIIDIGSGPDDSFIKSVWPLNIADYNLTSLMSNTNYNQGFQRSFVTGARAEEIQKVGEHLVSIVANENARIFTVEAGDPTAIEKERASLRKEMHRRGKFEFNQLSDDTRDAQSAESKEKDLITRRGIYDYVLDLFEFKLAEMLALHAEFDGEQAQDISITIDRDYGLEDQERIYQEEDSTAALAREVGAIEVQKEILRARVRRMKVTPKDGESEEETRQRLLDSIENAQPASSGLTNFASVNRPQIGALLT